MLADKATKRLMPSVATHDPEHVNPLYKVGYPRTPYFDLGVVAEAPRYAAVSVRVDVGTQHTPNCFKLLGAGVRFA
jgi:hypothetical protein